MIKHKTDPFRLFHLTGYKLRKGRKTTMMISSTCIRGIAALLFCIFPAVCVAFLVAKPSTTTTTAVVPQRYNAGIGISSGIRSSSKRYQSQQQPQRTVTIDTELTDEKVASLFAWVSRAFAGIPEYNNLIWGIVAIFGNLPEDSEPVQMLRKAQAHLLVNNNNMSNNSSCEEQLMGDPLSIADREYYSLGAMGAGQWMGQYKTRPHALLELQKNNITHVNDWVKSLPRGCRRTIQRALAQNFTVTSKPILDNQPAPHSSLAHFRCVVAHEVRLLSDTYGFVDALAEGVSRYVGTTRMTGEIIEYRNITTNRVMAIAHQVRKGKTIRGQWFYCDDNAAKNYIWFHSVYQLVKQAIETNGTVTCVDLGPSGSDSFSELKARYGFQSVDDWPAVADYTGDFYYLGSPSVKQQRRKGSIWSLLDNL